MKTTKTVSALVTTAMAAVLALAGCASNVGEEEPSEGVSSSEALVPTPTYKTVRGSATPSNTHTQCFVEVVSPFLVTYATASYPRITESALQAATMALEVASLTIHPGNAYAYVSCGDYEAVSCPARFTPSGCQSFVSQLFFDSLDF